MDPLIILIAALVVPLLAMMILRINAGIVFLALCLGNVLVQINGPDAATIMSSASARPPGSPAPSQSYVNLVLLLLPVILTMVIMIHSVKTRAKLAFNLLPAIGVATLGVLITVPLLSAGLTGAIVREPLWKELENLQSLILSASAGLCLLFLWMQRPRPAHDDKKGKHH